MGKLSKLIGDEVKQILDMSDEARIARAKEMGFDTDTVYYHGTHSNFDEFSKKYLGDNTMSNASDPAYGATSMAGFHHNTGEIKSAPGSPYDSYMENYLRVENPLEIDSLDDFAEELRGEIPRYYDDTQEVYDAVQNWVSKQKELGYDGVRFNDEEFGGVSVVPFDPNQIRSIKAAFDPAKKDSSNLMAGVVPAGVGLASLLKPEESQAAQSNYATPNAKLSEYISTIGGKPIDSNPLGLPQSKEDYSFNQARIQPSNADVYARIQPSNSNVYARAPVHPNAVKMAEAFTTYNKKIAGTPLEYVLPEAPADWAYKLAYDGKTRISDRLLAALGML